MSLAVHHLAVVTGDLDRAERFYCGVLGLEVVRRHTDDQGAPRSFWVGLGGGAFLAVELARVSGKAPADHAPGWHCVALGIPTGERASWAARLSDAGHPVVRETRYTIYARDPDGNLIGLSHFPEPSP